MSERAMRRAAEQRARKALLTACRAQGCTCDVEAEVLRWHGAIPEVAARHDDWCPLLRVMQERGPDRAPQIVHHVARAMTGPVRALIARMLWAGMTPDRIANTTGEPLADVQAIDAEICHDPRPAR
jgi:hypothetical protein